jgi:phenylalanyl-tRNA synthetase alpha subunit
MSKNLPRGQYDASQPEAPIAQVREILFGAQLKDMEMRFRRQEEKLLREINEVKDSLRGRLDSLENFMKSEVSAILNRLREEHEDREQALKSEQNQRQEELAAAVRERNDLLSQSRRDFTDSLAQEKRERVEALARVTSDLATAAENSERRAAKLTSSLDLVERTLRELLMTESSNLSDKIDEKYNDALDIIEKTSAQIRSDMVYRTALSTMFTEMVASLSKPWNLDISLGDDDGQDIVVVDNQAESFESSEGANSGDSNQNSY